MNTGKNNVWVGNLRPESSYINFNTALDRVFESGSSSIQSIAIKINLCDYRSAESGATTDPVLLGTLLDVLHNRFKNCAITIIENDATSVDIKSAYRILGFEETARKHGAELCNVAHGEWITKKIPNGIVFQELEIPTILESTDLFINFAKLKTNGLTKMTGCLKNIYGLLRIKRKVTLHNRIDQVLADMNKVIRPDLCLVDGHIAMEGMGGPSFGSPKRCELLVAGTNPVSVDACCARIMGFQPLRVKHIKLCHQSGLGPIDYKLETDIDNFNYRRYKFRFEYWEYWLRNLVRSRGGFAT